MPQQPPNTIAIASQCRSNPQNKLGTLATPHHHHSKRATCPSKCYRNPQNTLATTYECPSHHLATPWQPLRSFQQHHMLRGHHVRVRLYHSLLLHVFWKSRLCCSIHEVTFCFIDTSHHMLVHELQYVTQYLTIRLNFLWQMFVLSMALSLTILNRQ